MNVKQTELAINGGEPIRAEALPPRGLIGVEEKEAAIALFDQAIETGQAFGYQGPTRTQYEEDFAAFMGGGFAVGVNSGTNAVYCALGALQLDPLSEVIVPPITDPGGVMPVALLGCVPVFADSAPGCFNTSAEQIEPLINERTRAILIAHIAGEPVDMDPVMELARAHNLAVVEDCSQAHGATYKGRKVGTFGDYGAFSTMFGKHHCTGGQGGVVFTADPERLEKIRQFSDRGKRFFDGGVENVMAGLNCNMDDLSGAIGSAQLKKLPQIIAARRRTGEAVKAGLERTETIRLGKQLEESDPVYWFLRIELALDRLSVDKATFCKALGAELKGLVVVAEYRFIHCFAPWFKNKAVFGTSGFPWSDPSYSGPRDPVFDMNNAEHAADTQFVIIMHENYGDQEAEEIVKAIAKVESAYLSS